MFDSLYENCDVAIPNLPNPMWKGSEALHNKETNEIFQYTQFPIFNWFNKDLHTGIVDRTFVGVTGDRFFTIVLPASGKMSIDTTQTTKAMSYDTRCTPFMSMKPHNPDDEYQHFMLVDDKIVPKKCSNQRLTLKGSSSSPCYDGAMLRLNAERGGSVSPYQELRVRRDGSIVSGE